MDVPYVKTKTDRLSNFLKRCCVISFFVHNLYYFKLIMSGAIKRIVKTEVYHYSVYCSFYCIRRYLTSYKKTHYSHLCTS